MIYKHTGSHENGTMKQSNNEIAKNQVSYWLFAAWLIALAASFGALFIGEVLGQTPCVLCWYQRIAMFPLAWILGVACITNHQQVVRYALPLALIGGGIALWHSLLYVGIVEEALVPCQRSGPSCTDSAMLTFGGLPIPYLSLMSFIAITLFLSVFHFKFRYSENKS